MIFPCIYIIICTRYLGKYYVGSALNFFERKSRHLFDLRKQKHSCKYLQRVFDKKQDLQFYILEEVKDLSKLLDREDYYLQDYFDFDNELYNECFVAGSPIFSKRSKKQKENISKSLIGNKYGKGNTGKKRPAFTEETKKKISKNHSNVSGKNNPMYGIHRFGEENPMYGKHHSEETRKRQSIAAKNRNL